MRKFLIGLIVLLVGAIAHEAAGQQDMEELKKTLISKEKDSTDFTSTKTIGFIAEIYTYQNLLYDTFGIGGYYVAGTYRLLPKSTIGLGYDYSIYNHSILVDFRQELSRMRMKPALLVNLGYAFLGNTQTVNSSLAVSQEVQAKPNIVYKVGVGARIYLSKKTPIGLNFGFFYKNEPGFELAESKSGIITIEKYRNTGSLCLFLGVSF
jgi:hypothetical protein